MDSTDTGIDRAFQEAEGENPLQNIYEDEPVETTEPEEESDDEPEEEVEVESSEESEETEESFTGLKSDEIPEALKPIQKSLQADYTKKMQELAEMRKEAEEGKQTAEQIKAENERIRNLVARAQQGDQYAWMELNRLQQPQPESEEERINRLITQREEEKFYESARAEYPVLDPRVKESSPDYDPQLDIWLRAKLSDLLDSHNNKEGTIVGFDYKSEAKSLIAQWDKYLSDRNKAYLEKQNKVAKEKSKETVKQAPKTTAGDTSPNKKMSLDEAVEQALSEMA